MLLYCGDGQSALGQSGIYEFSNVNLNVHSNITDSPINISISERGKGEEASILVSETDYGANMQMQEVLLT